MQFLYSNTLVTRPLASLVVAVLLVFSAVGATAPNEANAQLPFGGRSISAVPCTCTLCFWVLIGPPMGGSYMYCPWITILYMYYNIFPVAWQLGLWTGFLPCLEWVYIDGWICVPIGGGGIMLMDGTSAI